MFRIFKPLVAIFLLSCSVLSMAFDQVVVFGDSLSDNGNALRRSTHIHRIKPSIPLIPDTHVYWKGRFSNGPIWAEDLAKSLGINTKDKHQFRDYAFGGAWVEKKTEAKEQIWLIPSLQRQLTLDYNSYLDLHPRESIRKHLFLIWGGANDYLLGRKNVDKATSQTVHDLGVMVKWLLDRHAKTIVVMNLPDLSLTNYAKKRDEALSSNLHELSVMHNQKLAVKMNELQFAYPDTHIILFDAADLMKQAIDNPAAYGLQDADSCYHGSWRQPSSHKHHHKKHHANSVEDHASVNEDPVLHMAQLMSQASGDNTVCTDPDNHFFFDLLHPSAYTHQQIANRVREALYF